MGRRPEDAECPLHEIGKAALRAFLAFCGEIIEGQQRRLAGQGFVDQICPVIGQASFRSQFVGNAFRGFQNGILCSLDPTAPVSALSHTALRAS